MDYNAIIQQLVEYARAHPYTAAAGVFLLLFLLFWRPKIFITLLVVALAAVGVMHLFAKLSSTGLSHKEIPFVD